jgi:SIR2-like domain
VSIATFRDPRVETIVKQYGAGPEIALFVGAGCSIEAGLPSWEELVQRLLDRAARERQLFDDDQERFEWVAAMLRVESLIDAAAVVESLLREGDLTRIVAEELFRTAPAGSIATSPTSDDGVPPAQIALQIAHLCEAFLDKDRKVRLYTTNYDNLIEEALRIRLGEEYRVAPYVEPDQALDDALVVHHLHGYLGNERPHTPVVLTARAYFSEPKQTWQAHSVIQTLADVPSLFLGTSLADLNLMRYLYERQGRRRHAAVFVRQAEHPSVPESVQRVREEATIKRWEADAVDVIFLDHYSDVAQVVAEIACAKAKPDTYSAMPKRAQRYFAPLRRRLLRDDVDREAFLRRQMLLNRTLSQILDSARIRLRESEIDLSREVGLALALWLIDDDGEYLTCWGSTDRLYTDPMSVQMTPVNPHYQFVASRAYCNGSYVEESRNFRRSRWSFIVGTPLWTRYDSDLGRIPIGSVTLMTKTPPSETTLARLSPTERATLAHALTIPTLSRLDDLRDQGA